MYGTVLLRAFPNFHEDYENHRQKQRDYAEEPHHGKPEKTPDKSEYSQGSTRGFFSQNFRQKHHLERQKIHEVAEFLGSFQNGI
jgi:hypothetical protein